MELTKIWGEWLQKEMQKPFFENIKKVVSEDRKTHQVAPASADLFYPLLCTPFEKIRIVIIGEEPQANSNGLAFSSKHEISEELKWIYKEIAYTVSDGLFSPETVFGTNADLSPFALQGIMLFNARWTTLINSSENKELPHVNIGWEEFTADLIKFISDDNEENVYPKYRHGIIFWMLWGDARALKQHIVNPWSWNEFLVTSLQDSTKIPKICNVVLEAGYPGCNEKWLYNNHFRIATETLNIDWKLINAKK